MSYIEEITANHKALQDKLGEFASQLVEANSVVIAADAAVKAGDEGDAELREALTDANNAKNSILAKQGDVEESLRAAWEKIQAYNADPVAAVEANKQDELVAAIRKINPALVDPDKQQMALIAFVLSVVKMNDLKTPYEAGQLDLVLEAISKRLS